jgi:hypothetical protein
MIVENGRNGRREGLACHRRDRGSVEHSKTCLLFVKQVFLRSGLRMCPAEILSSINSAVGERGSARDFQILRCMSGLLQGDCRTAALLLVSRPLVPWCDSLHLADRNPSIPGRPGCLKGLSYPVLQSKPALSWIALFVCACKFLRAE